jgi:hypothetical protein
MTNFQKPSEIPKFDIVIVSSGRVPYLIRTLDSLEKSNLLKYASDFRIIVNCVEENAQNRIVSKIRKSEKFKGTIAFIDDRSHAGLLFAALTSSIESEMILYLEEDWLFSKNLDENLIQKILFVAVLYRQFSFSKFGNGKNNFQTITNYLAKYDGLIIHKESLFDSPLIAQTKLFTLNPSFISNKIINLLIREFPKYSELSGFALELEIGRLIGDLVPPSVINFDIPQLRIRHIGYVSTSQYLNFTKESLLTKSGVTFAFRDYTWRIYLFLPRRLREIVKRLWNLV